MKEQIVIRYTNLLRIRRLQVVIHIRVNSTSSIPATLTFPENPSKVPAGCARLLVFRGVGENVVDRTRVRRPQSFDL